MKKAYMFSILMAVLVVSALSIVSASTLIAGTTYNGDFTATIQGADVLVNCDGNERNATSQTNGEYAVTYIDEDDCGFGSNLTIEATKGSLYGFVEGDIHEDAYDTWDIAVTNIPMVPEFGFFVGVLTIMGALGVFFVIRRQ